MEPDAKWAEAGQAMRPALVKEIKARAKTPPSQHIKGTTKSLMAEVREQQQP